MLIASLDSKYQVTPKESFSVARQTEISLPLSGRAKECAKLIHVEELFLQTPSCTLWGTHRSWLGTRWETSPLFNVPKDTRAPLLMSAAWMLSGLQVTVLIVGAVILYSATNR
jgi:hypothetical protein